MPLAKFFFRGFEGVLCRDVFRQQVRILFHACHHSSNTTTAPALHLREHRCGISGQIPSFSLAPEPDKNQTRVKNLRPLRLLLRKTLRPDGEDERAKNPILRLLGMTWG